MSQGGRPLTLGPKLTEQFAAELKAVYYISTAAALVGISRSVVYHWQSVGNAELKRQERGQVFAREDAQLYIDFLLATIKANAEAEKELLDTVRAGKPGWQSAAWILERTRPEKYAIIDRKREAELLERIKELEANATRRSRTKAAKAPKASETNGHAG